MGGNAFVHAVSSSSPSLHTPRMSPEKYTQLKVLYEAKLRQILTKRKVSILKEAPEKTSYGDLDFIVESADEPIDWHSLGKLLGAAGLIIHSSGKVQSCSLAVRMDGLASPKLILFNSKHKPADWPKSVTVEEFAQIDLEVVPRELFEWHSFYSSYGGMSGLLGHMVHGLGFTVCDKGLMYRLSALEAAKEMEFVNIPDTFGRLFLSKDPQEVLCFLGLSYSAYQQGFTTVEDFYRWLSQCKLLSKDSIKTKRDDASGRQKERKRPLYTDFFTTWLPAHLSAKTPESKGAGITPELSTPSDRRQEVLTSALVFFNKQAEHEQMNTALMRKIQSQTVDNLLKPIVAKHSGLAGKKVNEIIRAFRRWVSFRGDVPYILRTPHDDEESEMHHFLGEEDKTLLQNETTVDAWVKKNIEVVKGLERERLKPSRLQA